MKGATTVRISDCSPNHHLAGGSVAGALQVRGNLSAFAGLSTATYAPAGSKPVQAWAAHDIKGMTPRPLVTARGSTG